MSSFRAALAARGIAFTIRVTGTTVVIVVREA